MMLIYIMWLAITMNTRLSSQMSANEGQMKVMGGEFCEFDTFEAICSPGYVIHIESAYYGRMHLGKCVLSDLGFVGCSSDVTDLLDQRCSGRLTCAIRMPDEKIASRRPCMTELKMYLETNYTCRKVIGIERARCGSCDFVKVTQPSGAIASIVTRQSGCGAAKCPWLIEAKPGQRLDISLVNYGWSMDTAKVDASCQVYATIKELATSKTYTVCAGNKRLRHVYTSQSHAIELRIVTGKPGKKDKSEFLLQYKFIGCEDLAPPVGGWARRDDDVITMGCNDTSATWSLTCKDDRWVGERHQCAGYYPGASGSIHLGSVRLPSGLSIVIIIAVAFVVGAFILCIGIIMFKKRYLQRHLPTEAYSTGKSITSPEVTTKEPLYMPPLYSRRESRDPEPTNQDRAYGRQENYMHIWERPLPEPGATDASCTPCSCPTATTAVHGGGQRVPEGEYNSLSSSAAGPSSSVPSQRRTLMYGNNTIARKQCEIPSPDSDNDHRYFQVDPETTFN